MPTMSVVDTYKIAKHNEISSPMQVQQCKKLAGCSKKLTCPRRVCHSGLELRNSSSLIEGWGKLLCMHLIMNYLKTLTTPLSLKRLINILLR